MTQGLRPSAKGRNRLICLIAGALLVSGPADAAIVSGAFNGVVTSASNADAVFGVASGSLPGMQVTGTFSYDTALLSAPTQSSPVTYAWYNASPTLPTLRMTTTINGVTFTYDSGYFGVVFTNHDTASLSGPGDGEIASPWQEFGIQVCNYSTYAYACGWFDVGAQNDAVQIVGDPANPVVAFSLHNIPVGDGIGTGSTETADCPGPLCSAQWSFSINSISVQAPEPISLVPFGTGVTCLTLIRRRDTRQTAAVEGS